MYAMVIDVTNILFTCIIYFFGGGRGYSLYHFNKFYCKENI